MSTSLRKQIGIGEAQELALGAEKAARVRAFRLLILLAQEMRTRMDEVLREDGLTTQQAALISVVDTLGSPPLTQAAASLGTTHQNLKQIAAALVRKGLLRMVPDEEDGRVRRLVTTAKSREYQETRSTASLEPVLTWFDAFSEEEVRTFFDLLWQLRESVAGVGVKGAGS